MGDPVARSAFESWEDAFLLAQRENVWRKYVAFGGNNPLRVEYLNELDRELARRGLGPKRFRVSLHENAGDTFVLHFDCDADDAEHAIEQAEDAYPNGAILHAAELNRPSRSC